MFENPRRGRQARNFTTNAPKILDLKSSSEQIFSQKLPLGAPVENFDRPRNDANVLCELLFYSCSCNNPYTGNGRTCNPVSGNQPGAPNGNFRENICSEDDLRSRIFGAFVVKCLG